MERETSPRDNTDDEQGLLSCWGRVKLKLPWRRRRRRSNDTRQRSIGWNVTKVFKSKRPRTAGGGFRYDPISYARNFDEGWDEDNEDRGFSSRYADPSIFKSLQVNDN